MLIDGGSVGDRGVGDQREVFLPHLLQIVPAPSGATDEDLAQLAASFPEHGSTNVPVDSAIVLRVTTLLRPETLGARTITLNGADGPVAVKATAAESGRLVFVTTTGRLNEDSVYTLQVDGAMDRQGRALPFTAVTFITAGQPQQRAPSADDAEDWVPGPSNLAGDWRSGRADSPWRTFPPLRAPAGVTALAGQVLLINGRPMPDVTLAIGGKKTESDGTGRFLLADIAPGQHELLIDGRPASQPGRQFGVFHARIYARAGETNVLPYTIWLTKLDTARAVRISSPTPSNVVITTPLIPGLELHIPKGTVVRDHEGRVATSISITPVPVDRPPFPLATGIVVPVYFTIQPGGAFVESPGGRWPEGVRLVYPNYGHERPGARGSTSGTTTRKSVDGTCMDWEA